MPPKKKQTPRNAFFYFMQEFKTKQGRQFKSMQEIADAAGPHWSRMSKEQRKPYEEMALREKNNVRGGKFTSDGLDVEQLENEEREEQMRIQEMRNNINYTWKVASTSGSLHDELMFIIHINTFFYCQSEDRHYPAEIAICCFNLEEGVLPQNVFHRIIKPGMVPLGYAHDAKKHSEETHQLRPPIAGEHENTIPEVFEEMKHFLSNKLSGSKRMPILYCDERRLKMVQHVLDGWCCDYGNGDFSFKVYDLQYMFRVLRNTVAEDEVWRSDTFSTRELEKDVYSHAVGICCEYHEVTNAENFCSRSAAIRQAYTICDNCCPDLRITLIPGVHLPDKAMTRRSGRSSSASSVTSESSYTNLKSSMREDDSSSVMSFSSKSEWDNQSLVSETSSSARTVDSDFNFPALGSAGGGGGARKKKNAGSMPASWNHFLPSDSSSVQSQESNGGGGSGRSYAGAMGTSGLSRRPMDMPSNFSMGRGRGRGEGDGNDFPALGRGRALALSRSRKINNTN